MARILPPDPNDYRRTQCRECYVKVEYSPEEVTSNYVTDYGGDGDTIYCIPCPKCKHSIRVSDPLKRA